jgi:hypothetical protein
MKANADLWRGAVFGEGTLNVDGAFNRDGAEALARMIR